VALNRNNGELDMHISVSTAGKRDYNVKIESCRYNYTVLHPEHV